MAKYLDQNGLSRVWNKIKTLLSGKVDTTRKINGKALSSDIVITSDDIEYTSNGDTITDKLDSLEDTAHLHSNKSVLDGITATKVANWDNLVNGIDSSTVDYRTQQITVQDALDSLYSQCSENAEGLSFLQNSKQDKLTAGSGITITNNVISSTGGSSDNLTSDDIQHIREDDTVTTVWNEITNLQYSVGEANQGVEMLDNRKQDKLTAGSGITISNNVISASGGGSSSGGWRYIANSVRYGSYIDFIASESMLNKMVYIEFYNDSKGYSLGTITFKMNSDYKTFPVLMYDESWGNFINVSCVLLPINESTYSYRLQYIANSNSDMFIDMSEGFGIGINVYIMDIN